MDIKFKARYSVDWKTNEGVVSGKDLDHHIDIWGSMDSVDELEECINEYLWGLDSEVFASEEDKPHFDELDEVEAVNVDALVSKYKHLIKEPSCCDSAPYSANFCPTCGKKLKD